MRGTLIPAALLASLLALATESGFAPAQNNNASPVDKNVPSFGIPIQLPPEPNAKSVPAFIIPIQVPAQPQDATGLAPAPPGASGRPLPINLATALALADARPLIIEAARAAVETEYGLYEQARVLWLPTVYVGAAMQRHDGGQADFLDGSTILGARTQFLAGAGRRRYSP